MRGLDLSSAQGFAQLLVGYISSWMLPLLMFFSALVLMLLVGGPMIHWLRAKRWRKDASEDEIWTVREDTPDTHQVKQGTPSMGGIGIIGVAIFTFVALGATLAGLSFAANNTAVSGAPWKQALLAALFLPAMVAAHALLGFTDDWSKATGRGGLRARAKLIVQIVLAVGFVLICLAFLFTQKYTGVRFLFWGLEETLDSPFLLTLGIGVLAFAIIATSNAVNLTDGIDGLAAGLVVQCGFAFMLLDVNFYEIGFSSALFWAALTGACLGFLWFNKYPARVFMGDTGSLALGAAVGAGAVLSRSVFLLPFIGFIFFVEMFSVIFQVLYFKWTKKFRGEGQRIFRRAPLHHHFELGGWSERRVVATFWLVNAIATCIGLTLWNMEVLPRFP